MPNPTQHAHIASIPFEVTDLDDAVDWALYTAGTRSGTGIAVRLANAFVVTLANERTDYRELLTTRGINFPDGAPVAWTMRHVGHPEAGRVRGPSFFTQTLERGQAIGLRHFFFGTDEEVLEAMVERIRHLYPTAIVVGAAAPDYREDPRELAAQLPASVNAETVDIVWVGLGTPKQDFVTDIVAAERGVMSAGVGAAFDFLAGSVREAPKFVQNSGLEWAFRLVAEPRRLWRRYLIGNARFLRLVLPQLLATRQPAPATAEFARAPHYDRVR